MEKTKEVCSFCGKESKTILDHPIQEYNERACGSCMKWIEDRAEKAKREFILLSMNKLREKFAK